MKKRLLIVIPAFVFGLSTLTHAGNGDNEKQQTFVQINQNINQSVKAELNSFLEIIPQGMEKQHGFNDRAEFAKAVPASIYRIVGISADGNTFQTNSYNVVVSVNSQYRAVLTVSLVDGKYEIETVGGAPLAEELQAYEKQNVLAENEEHIMLNVYSKASSFVANSNVNTGIENAAFFPLESAQVALQNEAGRARQISYKLDEAVEALELRAK